MSELHRWLEEVAKLTGNKLAAVKEQCLAGFVEDVADLRRIYDDGKLERVFPQAVLSNLVEAALKNGAPVSRSQPMSTAVTPLNHHPPTTMA